MRNRHRATWSKPPTRPGPASTREMTASRFVAEGVFTGFGNLPFDDATEAVEFVVEYSPEVSLLASGRDRRSGDDSDRGSSPMDYAVQAERGAVDKARALKGQVTGPLTLAFLLRVSGSHRAPRRGESPGDTRGQTSGAPDPCAVAANGTLAFGLIPPQEDHPVASTGELFARWLLSGSHLGDLARLAAHTMITATCGLGLQTPTAAAASFRQAAALSELVRQVARGTQLGTRHTRHTVP